MLCHGQSRLQIVVESGHDKNATDWNRRDCARGAAKRARGKTLLRQYAFLITKMSVQVLPLTKPNTLMRIGSAVVVIRRFGSPANLTASIVMIMLGRSLKIGAVIRGVSVLVMRRTTPTELRNHIETIKRSFFNLKNVTQRRQRMCKTTLVAKTTLPFKQKLMTIPLSVPSFIVEPTTIVRRSGIGTPGRPA